ncbi:hypothetical protein POTOM_025298 [Populus tomentosa]|uniref:MACPF domain-containing protein n=1 Tax=Populus tomentosa TaxID=118781 RepID=A0A8X8CX91_POPTO|nr:hypothetical protein POTOM_025298 [Populus tomentosa]
MGEGVSVNAAAMHTAMNAVQALGRGFDVNYDTRLLYCKGVTGSKVVEIDQEHARDLLLCGGIVLPNVSRDIKNSLIPSGRQSSGVCTFYEMVEYFNQKANLSGGLPLGCFNSAFSFTGSKHIDAAVSKTLSMDGYYIPLAKVQLMRSPLVLHENVKMAVPTCWDPPSLASFIENFGTHVITSVTIGGKDVIYVKQHQSSPLSTLEIKHYVQDIGNQRVVILAYLTAKEYTLSQLVRHILLGKKYRNHSFSLLLSYNHSFTSLRTKGSLFCSILSHFIAFEKLSLFANSHVTVILCRRGGDDLEQNHIQWARTVQSSPDVIEMSFVPMTDLLVGLPGKEHLSRAIALYLEYKPQIEELRYFLEFQIPRIWAPVQDNFTGHQRKEPVCPSLQFSMMGQKLYVSQEQISVGRKPVTGLRLCLEGAKQNRLRIHLQHLASLPKILLPYWDTHFTIGAPKWQGPEEQDSRWFEPVKWMNFSHVSTAPVENPETFIGDQSGVNIVTGAQLGVWDFGSRNVLYMKLLYSTIPGCTIRRSLWDHMPNDKSKKFPAVNNTSSGAGNKLAKFVDMSEMRRGPQDPPGHWLVTGGKLGVEKGRIALRVKYSLLNY